MAKSTQQDRDDTKPTLGVKCECPEKAVLNESQFVGLIFNLMPEEERELLPLRNHEPGECKNVLRVYAYKRGDSVLNLCSFCHQGGDVLVGSAISVTQ